MYRILMAGKYHNVCYFKYWLWGPFHNAYHASPLLALDEAPICGRNVCLPCLRLFLSTIDHF